MPESVAIPTRVTLQRVNLDSSWILSISGTRLLIDPWLLGSEVDYFPWFSEQWHVGPCLPPSDLSGRVDAIVLAHPFDDHCHERTLRALDDSLPIYAVPAAVSRLRKWGFPSARLHSLNPSTPTRVRSATVTLLPSNRFLDPLHTALLFTSASNYRVLYSPHGVHSPVSSYSIRVDLALVTLTRYDLPWYLGGAVSLGTEAAWKAVGQLGARVVVDTHSERKRAEGFVAKVARVTWFEGTGQAGEGRGVERWDDLEEHVVVE